MSILWRKTVGIILVKSFLHFQIWAIWHVTLLLLLDTEMLQYEGCVVPLKLLLVGVYIMRETFCEIDFSFMFFFIQSEASVSS